MYGDGCSCVGCRMSQPERRADDCPFDVGEPIRRLHEQYQTHLSPPPLSPYHPSTAARASLAELPYYMREVARLVDHYRRRQSTEEMQAQKRKRKRREQAKKAGIPI